MGDPRARSVGCRRGAVAQHLLVTLDDPSKPPTHRWTDLDSTLLADVVEPAAGFTGMLVIHNPTATACTPPGDPRVRRVRVEWVLADGSVELEHETDVLPPPFLAPGQFHVTPMHVFTPSESNNYVLRATTDDEVMFERHVLVAPVEPVAYAGSAKGMAAGLRLRTPASMTLTPRERAPLHVDAFNIGRKVGTPRRRTSASGGVGGKSMTTAARPSSRNTNTA